MEKLGRRRVVEDRVRATVRAMVDNEERWDQDHYVNECGTTFCFAGWALISAGYTVRTEPEPTGLWVNRSWFVSPEGVELRTARGWSDTEEVEQTVIELLGLDEQDAWSLFFTTGVTLEEMIEKVGRVTGVDLSDMIDEVRSRA